MTVLWPPRRTGWRAHLPLASAVPWGVLLLSVLVVLACFLIDPLTARLAEELPDGVRTGFDAITRLGNSDWILIPLGVLLLFLWFLRRRGLRLRTRAALHYTGAFALFAFVAVAGTGLVAVGLKYAFGRARPSYFAELGAYAFTGPTGDAAFASFPSGHATTMGALAVVVALLLPRWRVAAIAATLLVAFSRLLVGAHFFSDVAAGYLLGGWLAWLIAWAFAGSGVALEPTAGVWPVVRRPKRPGLAAKLGLGLPFGLASRRRLGDMPGPTSPTGRPPD